MKAHKNEDPMGHETRVALLEQSIGHINETLNRFEKRFDNLDNKIDFIDKKLDSKIDSLDKKIDNNISQLRTELRTEINDTAFGLRTEINSLASQSWSQFKWIIGTFLALFGGAVITLVLKSLHWIA